MSVLVVVAGLGLAILPGLLHRRIGRLPPVEACGLVSASVRAGLALIQVGLLATAAPTAFRILGIDSAADACAGLVGGEAPGGIVTAWVAAAAFGWMVFARRSARLHVRRIAVRMRIEPWAGTHRVREGIDHVTLQLAEPIAYAVPGPQPQVVVSEGLERRCTREELDVVLRHEASHLTHGHHRALGHARSLEAVLGAFPPAQATVRALRLAVERTADEDAIVSPDDRERIRSALLKVAMPSVPHPVMAFTGVDTVLQRLDALAAPRPVVAIDRAETLGLVLAAFAIVGIGAISWVLASHHLLLGFASFCL